MSIDAALKHGLLLDTNVLILFAVGIINPRWVGQFKRTEKYARRDFDRLLHTARQTARLITTPHILAEFSNLFFRDDFRIRQSLPAVQDAIRKWVELVVLKDQCIESPASARLGVTDVGIGIVAKRESVLVMTDDAALFRHLEQIGCAVVNINHLRSADYLQH